MVIAHNSIAPLDLLLINSPLFETSNHNPADSLPPLGLGYIATAVRNEGFSVVVLDAVYTDCGTSGVIDTIISSRPRFVGINVFSTNLGLVKQIITASFDAHIIVGGPAVRSLSEIILSWETSNYITILEGEAEKAFPALLNGALEGDPWLGREKRRNIIRIRPNHPLHPRVIDLPLDRNFFQNEPVFDSFWRVKEAHIITSRGCCYDCAFCGAARSVNSTPIRFRSATDIRAELSQIRDTIPTTTGIRVIDDLFIRNAGAIEQACRLFRETGFTWRAMAHASSFQGISNALYDQMRQSKCIELFLGVESGNPERRKLIGKPQAVAPTIEVVTNLLSAGIAVKAYFIFGFPGETEIEMQDTFSVAATMADVAARAGTSFRTSVFKFRPYHGTRIYNDLVASGVNIGKIEPDKQLSTVGRQQFNFTSENYSNVDLDTLNKFIKATQEL